MTRGDEDIEGGRLPKFLDTRKAGSEKIRGAPQICILQTQQDVEGGGGLLKNWTTSEGGGGAAKISSFESQYLHPPSPPCHIK